MIDTDNTAMSDPLFKLYQAPKEIMERINKFKHQAAPPPQPADWHNRPGDGAGYDAVRNHMTSTRQQGHTDANAAVAARADDDTDAASTKSLDSLLSSRLSNFLALMEGHLDRNKGDRTPDKAEFLEGQDGYRVDGGGGDDTIKAYNDAVINGGDGDDSVTAYNNALVYGGDGNDGVSVGSNSVVWGGNGDDTLFGQDQFLVDGGTGDDVIYAQNNAVVTARSGDDDIRVTDTGVVYAGMGNDTVRSSAGGIVDGGAGDDTIKGDSNSRFFGGAGDDRLHAAQYSALYGGDGDDTLLADKGSLLNGGAGNDRLQANGDAIVAGGTGDDYIRAGANATILFAKGDGRDVIDAMPKAALESHGFTTGRVLFGPDIKAEDLDMVRRGPHLVINVTDSDALVIRNVDDVTLPSLQFEDGSLLSADDIGRLTRTDDSPLSETLLTAGNEVRTGSDGDDEIHALNRVSVRGGAGDDSIVVGRDSTVHFGRGDGNDTLQGLQAFNMSADGQFSIDDHLSSARIRFDADITPNDVTVRRDGDGLLIALNDGSGSLRIPPNIIGGQSTPTLAFADGTQWTAGDVFARADAVTDMSA